MSWISEWLDRHPAPSAPAKPKGAEISYSQIRVFLQCPWLYKLRYVDGMRPGLTPPAALGLSIHRALEAFHREDASELDRLLELYEVNWVHAGFSTPQEQMEWHAKGERVLRKYWAGEETRRSEIVTVEREFLFLLGPHQVIGMIDRIDRRPDGDFEVIDYKTHLDFLSEAEAADDLQMGIYGLGAREGLAVEPRWITLYYVAADRKVSVAYDESREGEIKALITRVADLITSGRAFNPEPSHCPSCGLRDRCTKTNRASSVPGSKVARSDG